MKALLDAVTQQEMVTVKIGPQQKQYRIHKGLITYHSEYFGSAYSGQWKEADEKDVVLEDIEPAIFDVFVQWLYTQDMPSVEEIERILKVYPEDEEDGDPVITVLTKSLVFGDRFLSPAFRRGASRGIIEVLSADEPGTFTIFTAVKFSFENLPEEHIINELFIDLYCSHLVRTSASEESLYAHLLRRDMPYKFLVKVIARYSTGKTSSLRVWENRLSEHCKYYKNYDNCKRNTVKK